MGFSSRAPLLPLSLLMLAAVSGTVLRAQAPKPAAPPPETRTVETVVPGVEHIVLRRGDFSDKPGADRWTIHVLVLDPSQVRLELGRAMDEGVGTETVSSMAFRHGAVAAVNGGYFRTSGLYRGEPAGLVVVGGRVLSEPSRKRPGLAVANTSGGVRAGVVSLDFRAEITTEDGASRAVAGVDRPRGDDELILFTPEFHRTTLTGPGGVEAVVVDGMVTAVRDGRGSAAIPAEGYVLSASGAAGEWLRAHIRAGRTLTLKITADATPAPSFAPDFILGGGPVLIRAGKPAAASDPGAYDQAFSLKRHPRTAVGVRPDGRLVLVTVDGRQPKTSVGMTIAELEALMIELGAAEAVNLDGGGSTTMVIRDRVVNSPSDAAGERPVGDALLIFARSAAPVDRPGSPSRSSGQPGR